MDREPDVWKDYVVDVSGSSTVMLYVDGTLVFAYSCTPTYITNVRVRANGLGNPSDSWFDDIVIQTEPEGVEDE